jgi:hypothetical protein
MRYFVPFATLALVACGGGDTHDASESDTGTTTIASEAGSSTGGTATQAERDAYSADLYKKPGGLTGEAAAKYDKLPSEGQEYVDEKMAEYDRLCADRSDC